MQHSYFTIYEIDSNNPLNNYLYDIAEITFISPSSLLFYWTL